MTRRATLLELQAVIAEYWASVDRAPDMRRSSASFYSVGGEMVLGSLQIRGRDNIAAFFETRNEQELANRRTTRHLAANFRIHDESDVGATVVALVLVYSGNGDWPLPSAAPSAVGDFTFECVRDPSQGWVFAKVCGSSVFVGAGAPTFARGP